MTRVTFYIDGFNFYYGLRRARKLAYWENYNWIDVVKLCSSFLAKDQMLQKVVYFTASPLDPSKNSRQSAFLNANRIINKDKFEVVRGKYLKKDITCPYCNGTFHRPEEKKTDVNISVRMMADCAASVTDVVALVSADSDLIPPIEFIQTHYTDKRVKVYFPPSNFSNDINTYLILHKDKPILLMKNKWRFRNAIMPDKVTDGESVCVIPDKWKHGT